MSDPSMSRSVSPTIEDLKALQARLNLRDVHVVHLGPERFTIAHTDEERATIDLADCELHEWLLDEGGPPEPPGYYVVTLGEMDDPDEPCFTPFERGEAIGCSECNALGECTTECEVPPRCMSK